MNKLGVFFPDKGESALNSRSPFNGVYYDQRTGLLSEFYLDIMIKGQAFCQGLFSTPFCGRGSVCNHESEIEVVGELAEFCKKADFLPHRFMIKGQAFCQSFISTS